LIDLLFTFTFYIAENNLFLVSFITYCDSPPPFSDTEGSSNVSDDMTTTQHNSSNLGESSKTISNSSVKSVPAESVGESSTSHSIQTGMKRTADNVDSDGSENARDFKKVKATADFDYRDRIFYKGDKCNIVDFTYHGRHDEVSVVSVGEGRLSDDDGHRVYGNLT
jgi:hypothetical protein